MQFCVQVGNFCGSLGFVTSQWFYHHG
jgi:hypothetical protein